MGRLRIEYEVCFSGKLDLWQPKASLHSQKQCIVVVIPLTERQILKYKCSFNQLNQQVKMSIKILTCWSTVALSFGVFLVCVRDCYLTITQILSGHGLQYTFLGLVE